MIELEPVPMPNKYQYPNFERHQIRPIAYMDSL